MDRRTLKSLVPGLLAVAALAVVLGIEDRREGIVVGVAGAVVVIALTVWFGRRGRHTSWSRATSLLGQGQAVVLWKPGCFYCERLMLQIGRDSRVTWVNVWQDEAAQHRVCALNGGDELTPTVLVGDDVLRNPTARQLRDRLS